MTANERRFVPRYKLRIPLTFRVLGELAAETQAIECLNVSVRGVYSKSNLPLKVGTPLEITMRMPREVTGKVSPELSCRSRVVRIDTRNASQRAVGVGVEILYCEKVTVYETLA